MNAAVGNDAVVALVAVEVSDCAGDMQAPRYGDILRCIGCGSTWSLIMNGIVRQDRATMIVAPVNADRVEEIGAGVAWFGCDDCACCRGSHARRKQCAACVRAPDPRESSPCFDCRELGTERVIPPQIPRHVAGLARAVVDHVKALLSGRSDDAALTEIVLDGAVQAYQVECLGEESP